MNVDDRRTLFIGVMLAALLAIVVVLAIGILA